MLGGRYRKVGRCVGGGGGPELLPGTRRRESAFEDGDSVSGSDNGGVGHSKTTGFG